MPNARVRGRHRDAHGATPDLLADIDEIDVPRLPLRRPLTLSFLRKPDGSTGMLALTPQAPTARLAIRFPLPEGGIDLTGFLWMGGVKATGSLSLRSRTPSAADMSRGHARALTLDQQVAGSVKIVDAPAAQASLKSAPRMPAKGSTYSVHAAQVSADGRCAPAYALQADGATASDHWASTAAAFSPKPAGLRRDIRWRGKLGSRDLHTVETAGPVRRSGAERAVAAASDGSRINLDGSLSEAAPTFTPRWPGWDLAARRGHGRPGGCDLALQERGPRLDRTFRPSWRRPRAARRPPASTARWGPTRHSAR